MGHAKTYSNLDQRGVRVHTQALLGEQAMPRVHPESVWHWEVHTQMHTREQVLQKGRLVEQPTQGDRCGPSATKTDRSTFDCKLTKMTVSFRKNSSGRHEGLRKFLSERHEGIIVG